MLFHSKFVSSHSSAAGGLGSQQRSDRGTGWREAIRSTGSAHCLPALATALFFINLFFFWWNSPIFIPLILSSSLCMVQPRECRRTFRMLGLLLIPRKTQPRNSNRSKQVCVQAEPLLPHSRCRGVLRAVIIRRECDSPGAFAGQRKKIHAGPLLQAGPVF